MVEPEHETVSNRTTPSSSGASFNVFTRDVSLNFSQGESSSTSTGYLASGFESHGDNVFSSGNGIHIVISQISGIRNTFDALMVNFENQANARESHSLSSDVGLSTNLGESLPPPHNLQLQLGPQTIGIQRGIFPFCFLWALNQYSRTSAFELRESVSSVSKH